MIKKYLNKIKKFFNKKIPVYVAISIVLFSSILVARFTYWESMKIVGEMREVIEVKISEEKNETANLVLFEKNENWGPCPPSMTCNQSTKLYYSGELILEGEKNIEKIIDGEAIERIKDKIRSSGVMNKDCWTEAPVPDYSATYIFNLEGEIKKMRYPNCGEELKEIEELIKI